MSFARMTWGVVLTLGLSALALLPVQARPPRPSAQLVLVKPPPAPDEDKAAVTAANNRFGFELLGRVSKPNTNAILSPFSISAALSMTYAGARGDTAAEMARTLHFAKEQDRWHPAVGALSAELQPTGDKPTYELQIANRLWGQRGAPFNDAFLKTTRNNYGAGIQALDFRNDTEAARETINAWVEEQTREKIKELIQKGQLREDTSLVLTNVIYFKSAWQIPFSKSATEPEEFRSGDGITKVPMMQATRYCRYASSETFEAVSLPYKDNVLSMLIVLPKKVDGLAEAEQEFNADRLADVLKKLELTRVELHLPKFKLRESYDLKDALSALGMPKAFLLKDADFSGISREPRFLDKVIHKALVEVDEEGAVAAAATAVRPPEKFKRPPEEEEKRPIVFKADHPFLFLIRENRTGTVLFLGRLVKPATK
jgi:serpin B